MTVQDSALFIEDAIFKKKSYEVKTVTLTHFTFYIVFKFFVQYH